MSRKRKIPMTEGELFEYMYTAPSDSEDSMEDSDSDGSDYVPDKCGKIGGEISGDQTDLEISGEQDTEAFASSSSVVQDVSGIHNGSLPTWNQDLDELLNSIQQSDDEGSEYICSSEDEYSSDSSQGNDLSNHFSDDEESSDADETDWKKNVSGNSVPQFSQSIVPTYPYTHKDHPLVYFSNVFPDHIIDKIVFQTNLYAAQKKSRHWKDTNIQEMKAFFGLQILMGLHPLSTVDLYWSTDPLYYNPQIAGVMPVKRFKKLMENLHLNDNQNMPERGSEAFDKLYKIRPLHDALNVTFSEAAKHPSVMSVDECMVKFKGRSSLKQYMPKKPIKRGYKIWARADANTGYLFAFEQYCGKNTDGTVLEGLGYKVVMDLAKDLPSGTLLVFDNFFTSVSLMQDLYTKGIYAIGTVQCTRKDLPLIMKSQATSPKKKRGQKPKKVKKNLQKGEYKWRRNQATVAFRWMDNKIVNVLSTVHDGAASDVVTRKQKDGSKIPVNCPVAIIDYTKYMGGVDRFDRLRASYPIGRKSKRYWIRLFCFLLDAAVCNAYILYTLVHKKGNQSHMSFRIRLGRALLSQHENQRKKKGPNPVLFQKKGPGLSVPEEIRLAKVGIHLPVGELKYKRCRLCSTRKSEKRTKVKCEACGVPLCAVPCFKQFHN